MQKERFIVHIDMDAFFAAIEQRDNSALAGKPVVVGADPKGGRGRGVVSTCSYEARKFGIHSAMPISIAYNKCPKAIFLPVNMEKYLRICGQIYHILDEFTPKVEPISIDEAFLDITGSYHLFGTPLKTCMSIKQKIKKETQLTASVGLAPTKMAAKIASDLNKPDGLLEVKEEELLSFLWPLPVDKIWGLGKKSKENLSLLGINTIGDLAKRDRKDLASLFGKNGEYFWLLAHGVDEREVQRQDETKSISNEITFDRDTADKSKIEATLLALCEKVSRRLRLGGYKAKTITLKVRLEGFYTYTRAMTLSQASNFDDVVYQAVKKLYKNFDTEGKNLRLLGVRLSNFICADTQDSIFKDTKRENIYKAIDTIKEKFGDSSIQRAAIRNN
ncbi:MAG: DNA polymerase IV [Candidatus Omnitrophota bacterium]|nr:DNA polymerase IV [Candidatus Omnitrophota bacterium]